MKLLALALWFTLLVSRAQAGDGRGSYVGSVRFPAVCTGVESAEIVLYNWSTTKLPGISRWWIYDLCGQVCYGVYEQPFNILPGRSTVLNYSSRGGLDRVDIYIFYGDIKMLTGYRKSDSCE